MLLADFAEVAFLAEVFLAVLLRLVWVRDADPVLEAAVGMVFSWTTTGKKRLNWVRLQPKVMQRRLYQESAMRNQAPQEGASLPGKA